MGVVDLAGSCGVNLVGGAGALVASKVRKWSFSVDSLLFGISSSQLRS